MTIFETILCVFLSAGYAALFVLIFYAVADALALNRKLDIKMQRMREQGYKI